MVRTVLSWQQHKVRLLLLNFFWSIQLLEANFQQTWVFPFPQRRRSESPSLHDLSHDQLMQESCVSETHKLNKFQFCCSLLWKFCHECSATDTGDVKKASHPLKVSELTATAQSAACLVKFSDLFSAIKRGISETNRFHYIIARGKVASVWRG